MLTGTCTPWLQLTLLCIPQSTQENKAPHPPKIAEGGEEHTEAFPSLVLQPPAGQRAETYFGFQQVITGFMVWWVWSIVRASRSQWRAQSWRKRGSLQKQRVEAQ